jgi:hypothetical protein
MTTEAEIAVELYEAARKLGATSDLLGIIGSYRDKREDEDVGDMLMAWNDRHGLQLRRAQTYNSVTDGIHNELYNAFEKLGAPPMLLGELGSWGDGISDMEVLLALKKYNQWGRTFDTIEHEVDETPGATALRDDEEDKPS